MVRGMLGQVRGHKWVAHRPLILCTSSAYIMVCEWTCVHAQFFCFSSKLKCFHGFVSGLVFSGLFPFLIRVHVSCFMHFAFLSLPSWTSSSMTGITFRENGKIEPKNVHCIPPQHKKLPHKDCLTKKRIYFAKSTYGLIPYLQTGENDF